MTPNRLTGSGPKNEAKMPGVPDDGGVADAGEPVQRGQEAALLLQPTAAITATMPISMMTPCTKSLMAVAI